MAKVLLMEDNTDRITQIIKPHNGRGGLYLGSQKAACDTNLLKSFSIRAVITVAAELNNKYPKDFEHLKINIDDQPLAYIYEHFEITYSFLNKNLQNGNVFVHCRMGISRSASIVIAYIMRAYNYPYQKVSITKYLGVCES